MLAERLATILPNVTVTDAQVIQDYYLARYNAPSKMIAYGSEVERRPDRAAVRRWRAEPNRMFCMFRGWNRKTMRTW